MRNELKRRLKKGEQTYGCWITIESPMCSEMMSTLGFDWFVFDTEHSPLDIYQTQTLMQAMRGAETTPIVRAWWNDLVAIKRALDIGAYGVVVPWVKSHPEVQKAIDRVYDATKAAGKAAGVHMASGKTIKDRMEKGYEFITIGNDLSLLMRGVRELMTELGLK